MEWTLFWTIAGQVFIGAVVLVFVALAVSLVVHVIRGTAGARVSTKERPYNPPRYPKIPSPEWSKSEPVGVTEMRRTGVNVDGDQNING